MQSLLGYQQQQQPSPWSPTRNSDLISMPYRCPIDNTGLENPGTTKSVSSDIEL